MVAGPGLKVDAVEEDPNCKESSGIVGALQDKDDVSFQAKGSPLEMSVDWMRVGEGFVGV